MGQGTHMYIHVLTIINMLGCFKKLIMRSTFTITAFVTKYQ